MEEEVVEVEEEEGGDDDDNEEEAREGGDDDGGGGGCSMSCRKAPGRTATDEVVATGATSLKSWLLVTRSCC